MREEERRRECSCSPLGMEGRTSRVVIVSTADSEGLPFAAKTIAPRYLDEPCIDEKCFLLICTLTRHSTLSNLSAFVPLSRPNDFQLPGDSPGSLLRSISLKSYITSRLLRWPSWRFETVTNMVINSIGQRFRVWNVESTKCSRATRTLSCFCVFFWISTLLCSVRFRTWHLD